MAEGIFSRFKRLFLRPSIREYVRYETEELRYLNRLQSRLEQDTQRHVGEAIELLRSATEGTTTNTEKDIKKAASKVDRVLADDVAAEQHARNLAGHNNILGDKIDLKFDAWLKKIFTSLTIFRDLYNQSNGKPSPDTARKMLKALDSAAMALRVTTGEGGIRVIMRKLQADIEAKEYQHRLDDFILAMQKQALRWQNVVVRARGQVSRTMSDDRRAQLAETLLTEAEKVTRLQEETETLQRTITHTRHLRANVWMSYRNCYMDTVHLLINIKVAFEVAVQFLHETQTTPSLSEFKWQSTITQLEKLMHETEQLRQLLQDFYHTLEQKAVAGIPA